jgi:SAM-dependent methyltransferase
MRVIYDHPWAYELACEFRDIPAEVDALLGWCASPPTSVLELAAGPAEHAREFARRGIEATALDLNAVMCAYAEDQARQAAVRLKVVHDDMTNFDLGRTYDLVVTMLDSTAHLMTLDAMVAHFDRVAEHLAPDGRYILEMSHPSDRLTDDHRVSSTWDFRQEGLTGKVSWGEPGDVLDPITQIVDEHVTITVTREDRTEIVQGVVPYRFWTATELTAAIRLSGRLQVEFQFGDFAGVPLTSPKAWRMITVLHPR